MQLTCRAIIFDLDGVLVDSNPIVERHWRRWASQHELPYDEIARTHHGRPTIEIIRQVAPHLDAEAEARAKEMAEADDTDGLTAFEGAAALLARLPAGRWAIATSGSRRTASIRLRHVGLDAPEVLVTSDDVTRGKPAPEPYLLAAERLGLDAGDCVVIEDAPAGITAAKAARARVVAVASTNPVGELAEADAVADRISALRVRAAGDQLVVSVGVAGEGPER